MQGALAWAAGAQDKMPAEAVRWETAAAVETPATAETARVAIPEELDSSSTQRQLHDDVGTVHRAHLPRAMCQQASPGPCHSPISSSKAGCIFQNRTIISGCAKMMAALTRSREPFKYEFA